MKKSLFIIFITVLLCSCEAQAGRDFNYGVETTVPKIANESRRDCYYLQEPGECTIINMDQYKQLRTSEIPTDVDIIWMRTPAMHSNPDDPNEKAYHLDAIKLNGYHGLELQQRDDTGPYTTLCVCPK